MSRELLDCLMILCSPFRRLSVVMDQRSLMFSTGSTGISKLLSLKNVCVCVTSHFYLGTLNHRRRVFIWVVNFAEYNGASL